MYSLDTHELVYSVVVSWTRKLGCRVGNIADLALWIWISTTRRSMMLAMPQVQT
jgi:hypothetical protein